MRPTVALRVHARCLSWCFLLWPFKQWQQLGLLPLCSSSSPLHWHWWWCFRSSHTYATQGRSTSGGRSTNGTRPAHCNLPRHGRLSNWRHLPASFCSPWRPSCGDRNVWYCSWWIVKFGAIMHSCRRCPIHSLPMHPVGMPLCDVIECVCLFGTTLTCALYV